MNRKKIFIIASFIFLILIFYCCFYFLFLFSSVYLSKNENIELNKVVSNFILNKYFIGYYPTDDKFEAHHMFGVDKINDLYYIYLYVLFEGYSFDEGKYKCLSGGSNPLVIIVKKNNKSFDIIKYKEPENGENYAKSLKQIFPLKYFLQISKYENNNSALKEDIYKQVISKLKDKGKSEEMLFRF